MEEMAEQGLRTRVVRVEPAQLVVLVAQPLVEVLRELLFWEQFREVIIPEILLSMREMVVRREMVAVAALVEQTLREVQVQLLVTAVRAVLQLQVVLQGRVRV
jgi:hypothetical protein